MVGKGRHDLGIFLADVLAPDHQDTVELFTGPQGGEQIACDVQFSQQIGERVALQTFVLFHNKDGFAPSQYFAQRPGMQIFESQAVERIPVGGQSGLKLLCGNRATFDHPTRRRLQMAGDQTMHLQAPELLAGRLDDMLAIEDMLGAQCGLIKRS